MTKKNEKINSETPEIFGRKCWKRQNNDGDDGRRQNNKNKRWKDNIHRRQDDGL